MRMSDLAQELFYLNGIPLNIDPKSMRHLLPIYNSQSSAKVLKFGRQTHKSTTISVNMMLPALKIPNYHVVYVAPTGKQVSVFADDKLKNLTRESPIVREVFLDTSTKDQVYYKEFSNHSKLYLRSAYHSADSVRGISGDSTFFDEVQDLVSDHIPVIEQCMAHSISKYSHMRHAYPQIPPHLFSNKWYAGTPKTIENTLERYWAKSSQCEWIIKCEHCDRFNYIDEQNIGLLGLICRKCGKPIWYRNGSYVAMNHGASIDGYRMPQIVLDWVNDPTNPRAWKEQVLYTRETYSPEKFSNEALALPYANARNPLSPTDLMSCCSDRENMVGDCLNSEQTRFIAYNQTYAGIDWGKGDLGNGTSYTHLNISMLLNGKHTVIFHKKYTGRLSDPLLQIDDILFHIERFNCVFTIADHGDGRTSNALIVERLGPGRFAELYEHGTLKKKIIWEPDKAMYIINRTQVMTDMFMEIKRGQVDFFKYDEFKEFGIDFLNIYTEYSDKTRMTKYDHIGADDAFHSYMYSRVAAKLAAGDYNRYILGIDNDPNSAYHGMGY